VLPLRKKRRKKRRKKKKKKRRRRGVLLAKGQRLMQRSRMKDQRWAQRLLGLQRREE
jgi:hypothetical protein